MQMTQITYTFHVKGVEELIDISYLTPAERLHDPAFDPKAPILAMLTATPDRCNCIKATRRDDA